MWLRQIPLNTRILTLVAMIIASFIGIGAISMEQVRENIYQERKRTLTAVVDLASSIANSFYQQYRAGEISESNAKQNAIAALRDLRYETNNYVWVNDMESNIVLHPNNPEIEDTNVSDMRDPNGLAMFPLFVETVQTQGSGFVEYIWDYKGSNTPEGKISFVKGFAPWGWVIGTGVYVVDLEETLSSVLASTILYSVLFLMVIGVLMFFLLKSISGPINAMVKTGHQLIEGNNVYLQRHFKENGNDDLTQLSKALNTVFSKIQSTLERVSTTQHVVSENSDTVAGAVHNTHLSLTQQQREITSLSEAMAALADSVSQVSSDTQLAVRLSAEANQVASDGSNVIETTVAEIQQLLQTMNSTKSSMESLAQDVDCIHSVLDVINGIAEQTNLLALNAAIEAARAGEQGRGFAVVADEVRQLAQRTQHSTQEIQDIIGRLQSGTSDAVGLMTRSSERAEIASERSQSAGVAFESIRRSILDIDSNTSKIASASHHQAETSAAIARSVNNIQEAMEPVRQSIETTEQSANQLNTAIHDVETEMRHIILR